MKRVVILGSGGAGKSTLARRLGDITGLPVVHLDTLFWLPGWKERDKEEFDRMLLDEVAKDRWIIDGNYSRTMPPRLAAADTILWLDYSRWRCLWGVLKRRVMYHGKTRPDMNAGCAEKIDLEFLMWVWNYPKRSREATREHLAKHAAGKTVHRFEKPAQMERWLRGIRR